MASIQDLINQYMKSPKKDPIEVAPEPNYDLAPQVPDAPIDPMQVPPEPNYDQALQGLEQASAPAPSPEESLFKRASDQMTNQQAAGNLPMGGIEDAAPAAAPSVARRLMNAAMPAAEAADQPAAAPAPADPSVPDYFSDDAMKKAQGDRDALINKKADMDNLDKLATAMGSLGSGQQLKKFGGTDHLEKLAGTKVSDVESLRKGAKEKLSFEDALRDAKSEKEKGDPNSPYSKLMREFLGKIGVSVPEGTSGAQLEKAAPWAVKIFEAENQKELAKAKMAELAAMRAATNDRLKNKDTNKDFATMNKLITEEIASGRTVLGKAAGSVQAVDRMEAAIAGKDLNSVTPEMVAELALGLNTLLTTGSQPAVSTFEKLLPKNISKDAASLRQYILSRPQGAGNAEFIKNMMAIAQREKEVAKKQIKGTQNKLVAGFEHLKDANPQRYNRTLKSHGLVADESPASPAQMSTAEKWLQANPNHPDAASLREHLGKMKK